MKQIFTFFLILLSTFIWAQCTISGPTVFQVGQTVTFSIPNTLGQCNDCYDWDVNNSNNNAGGTVSITGSDQNNVVSIIGVSAGTFSIKVTYFTETGCQECTVGGTIVPVGITCCSQIVDLTYICKSGASSGHSGFVKIKNPAGCNFWSTVSKIDVDLSTAGNTTFSPSNPNYGLSGLNVGTIYPPFNLVLINSNGQYQLQLPIRSLTNCPSDLFCIVKLYFNNGCPSVSLQAEGFDPAQNRNSDNTYNEIKVYPNPVEDVISFEGKNLEKYTISITDSNGRVIMEDKPISKPLDLKSVNKGLIFYKIINKDGYEQIGKLIKN